MDYQIVTIANKRPSEPYYTFDEFFASTRGRQGLVLGSYPGEYGGLGSKPRLLYHAIKQGLVTAKHIIFSDCFDVVFAVHPDDLFFQFKNAFKVPFVISAEKTCFPSTYKEQYDALPVNAAPFDTSYKYLNSGMIVAETEAMLAVLEAMDAPNIPNDYYDYATNTQVNPNDQEYYQKVFLEQPVPMELDVMQILSNTLHNVTLEELDFTERQIRNVETGCYPCAFHFNGGAKTGGLREPILKHLGYLK